MSAPAEVAEQLTRLLKTEDMISRVVSATGAVCLVAEGLAATLSHIESTQWMMEALDYAARDAHDLAEHVAAVAQGRATRWAAHDDDE